MDLVVDAGVAGGAQVCRGARRATLTFIVKVWSGADHFFDFLLTTFSSTRAATSRLRPKAGLLAVGDLRIDRHASDRSKTIFVALMRLRANASAKNVDGRDEP